MSGKYSELEENTALHAAELRRAGKLLSEAWKSEASEICRAASDRICLKLSEICDEAANLKRQEENQ